MERDRHWPRGFECSSHSSLTSTVIGLFYSKGKIEGMCNTLIVPGSSGYDSALMRDSYMLG